MVEVTANHPLDHFLARHGSDRKSDLQVEIRRDHGIAHLFASNGKSKTIEKLLSIAETPGMATVTRSLTALPISPGQWLLISAKPEAKQAFTERLAKKIKGSGFVSEQSDARVICRVSGSRAIDFLQKECRLDLHSPTVGKNWCASTQMAHIGVFMHRVDEKPVFDLYVYSGFAEEFAGWILHAGQQLDVQFLLK